MKSNVLILIRNFSFKNRIVFVMKQNYTTFNKNRIYNFLNEQILNCLI